MERNNIKFKYLMNLWKVLPSYPNPDDVVYELSVYMVKDGRPNGSFSDQTLRHVFGKEWDTPVFQNLFKKMLSDETITEDLTKNSNQKVKKTWYKIKDNPYYR